MVVATRNSKKLRTSKVSDPDTLFSSLASSIASAQVSKQPFLKHLLYILNQLSLNRPINWDSCDVASHYWNLKSSGEEVESISFVDVCDLSDVLFTELDRSFESLFSTLCKENAETCYTFSSSEESIELAILYLRCCLKIITLLLPEQDLVLEKAKTLLSVLSGLISATFGGSSSLLFTHDESRRMFLCSGLEVFIDVVLVNNSIRDLFFLVDPAFSSCILFSKHDWAGVMEMVSAHFILSLSDEKMNKMYVERLYWKQVSPVKPPPQLTMSAATSLLLDSAMFSAPRMIHAYVVLLVSDAVGSCCVKGLDLQLFDRCIDAFDKSVVLYTRYMSKEENNSSGKKVGVLMSSSRMRIAHLLLPSTLEKVNEVALKLKASWRSYQSDNSKIENDELVACSVAYAKESLSIFDTSCSNNMLSQILSFLGCVILRASSDDVMDSVLQKYSASGVEDLYLLASILKLMSCSMLQAIWVLRHLSEDVGDVRSCKEYKSMMDVVQRFEKFSVHLPGQSFLHDKMESHLHVDLKSKWMLMHFSGLLSISFALKLDFLMKGSIFGMVVSLYLFILEGGDLESLGHSESPSSSIPSSGYLEASGKAEETAAVDRKLSEAVALRFQKTRTLYLGKLSEAKDAENGSDAGVGVEENSCNGEKFLWCMAGKGNMKSSDVEELADFIVCEPGKDYSDWLKGRERFRSQKWRAGKIGLERWNKKQKAWRENKRKV